MTDKEFRQFAFALGAFLQQWAGESPESPEPEDETPDDRLLPDGDDDKQHTPQQVCLMFGITDNTLRGWWQHEDAADRYFPRPDSPEDSHRKWWYGETLVDWQAWRHADEFTRKDVGTWRRSGQPSFEQWRDGGGFATPS